MSKKLLLLLMLIVFIFCGCVQKSSKYDLYEYIVKNGKIIVGISFDSKPFGFKDKDGQIKGIEADLAREIAQRILGDKNKVIFRNVASQDRINALKSGYVDMVISTMTITPQRKRLVNFSDPYFIAGQAIAVRKDSKINSHYDLINKRVIVELGTTGERNIKRFIPNALIQGYDNNSEAIEAFKNNSYIDAITTDDSLLQGLVMENSNYMILPQRLTQEPYGIAFKKSQLTQSLRNKINEIIHEIKIDGTLQQIKDKWGITLQN